MNRKQLCIKLGREHFYEQTRTNRNASNVVHGPFIIHGNSGPNASGGLLRMGSVQGKSASADRHFKLVYGGKIGVK